MTRVAVLMGGFSSEREVSLSSGKGCVEGLRNAGYEVTAIDVTRDLNALLSALDPAPDAVFNALHGPFGEDGRIQGMLDILGIPLHPFRRHRLGYGDGQVGQPGDVRA